MIQQKQTYFTCLFKQKIRKKNRKYKKHNNLLFNDKKTNIKT